MSDFHSVPAAQFSPLFDRIGKDWMLISLPEDVAQRKIVLDYLNAHEGVSAEEVTEHV